MPLDLLHTVEIIELMENYVQRVRPPEHIRDRLDINYKIESQSIILITIRPALLDPSLKIESPYAKATYLKREDRWKIYWMPGNLKWTVYSDQPNVKNLKDFIAVVEADKFGCFHG
jgi:hypothetical protein